MPGIAGILGTVARAENRSALERMLNCMLHEPFYTHGSRVDERLGLWSGWVAAAGSFSDGAPLWNETKDIFLVFSGEEFTDAASLDELRARGHVFDPGTASYLVHLYEEKGACFLEDLNGCFSGLLVDLRENKLILFNDRYGVNRIYYHANGNGLYFSSEAKSLLRVVPDLRELDSKGLAEFLACGCVLQNRTLFRGISLLPPGSVWTFVPGRPLRKELYFKREGWEKQPTLELPEYFEQFKHTWKRILPRYFRGRERIGLSLTGGVDSRMILAWSPPVEGGLSCYTFGGKYRECADVAISRKVAESCHLKHEVLKIDDEFLSRFPELAPKAVYVSDGGMDVTGSIDLYLQQRARQIAPVRVTGTNGGEILRSLVVFKPNSLCSGVFTPELERLGGETMAAYQQELQGNPLSFTAFKQAPWYMGSKFILERSLVTLRMPYFDNDLISLVYRAPSELRAGNDFSRRLIAEGNPALARIVTDLGGSGVSASPLARLRRLFQEFTFKAEYAYDYGMPQWLARLEPVLGPLHLERLFLGRHKIHHFRLFYRNELSAYLKEILLDGRAARRGYLRDGCLERVVNEHLRGHRNHTREIHKLLTLELVHRSLLEQI